MKFTLAQLHYRAKNETYNNALIIKNIQKAIAEKSDIIFFSSIYEKDFYSYCQMQFLASMDILHQQVEELLPLSEKIGIVLPFLLKTNQRKRTLFYYLYQGNISQKIFDYHYLYGEGFHYEFTHKECCFGVDFFEDIMTNNKGNFMGKIHQKNLPQKDIVLLLANASFGIQSFEKRCRLLKEFVKYQNCHCIFLNTCGEYEGKIYEGASVVVDKQQQVIKKLDSFQQEIIHLDTSIDYDSISINTPIVQENDILKYLTNPHYIAQVYQALKMGIKDYFQNFGFSKAVLGLSGGIDSAVVACIASDALGKENITTLLLPSRFSSSHSVEDALQLTKNLNITSHLLSIENMYDTALQALNPLFQNAPADVTEENLQSRIRGLLLMAVCNKQNSLLLNTSNKSELSVGYGTLYGDLNGAISILGGLYKTQVYALAKYINREQIIIPQHSIDKAPSAELKPNQKDIDSLPAYDILDPILYLYIDKKISIDTIISEYNFDKEMVDKIMNLYKKNRYKATQICDILKVSIS